MTSGDDGTVDVRFTLRQFKLLHQVTKEIPNLGDAQLAAAGCPAPLARRFLDLVRQGRAEIGDRQAVTIGFDESPALELRRDIGVRPDGDVLVVDSGTTTAAAQAWRRLADEIAASLGTPEFDHRTGATVTDAAGVFDLLSDAARTGRTEG